jgi:hypothetical protein
VYTVNPVGARAAEQKGSLSAAAGFQFRAEALRGESRRCGRVVNLQHRSPRVWRRQAAERKEGTPSGAPSEGLSEAEARLQLDCPAAQRAAGNAEVRVWNHRAVRRHRTQIRVERRNVKVRFIEQVVNVGADFEPGALS